MSVHSETEHQFTWTLSSSGQHSFSDVGQSVRLFRMLELIGTVGVGLSVYGGSNSTSSNPETQRNSNTFRHVGTILFAVLYVVLVLLHVLCWLQFKTLTKNGRTVCLLLVQSASFSPIVSTAAHRHLLRSTIPWYPCALFHTILVFWLLDFHRIIRPQHQFACEIQYGIW